MRTSCDSPSRYSPAHSGSGFSLLELLIVLAILTTVAGLTIPAMRGTLDRGRLVSGAKDVQAALGKARSLAVRESGAVQFRYQLGGRRFVIELVEPPTSRPIIVLDDARTVSENTPDNPGTTSGSGTPFADNERLRDTDIRGKAGRLLREGLLPAGITFSASPDILFERRRPDFLSAESDLSSRSSTALSATNNSVDASAGAVPAAGDASAAGMTLQWSAPVVFHPGGRATDALIRLHGPRDFHVDVTLRGLTATASYLAPRRLPESAMNVTPDVETTSSIPGGSP